MHRPRGGVLATRVSDVRQGVAEQLLAQIPETLSAPASAVLVVVERSVGGEHAQPEDDRDEIGELLLVVLVG